MSCVLSRDHDLCTRLEENMVVDYHDRPLQRSPNVTLRMFSAWNTAKAQESTIRAQNHAWMSSQLKSEAGIEFHVKNWV